MYLILYDMKDRIPANGDPKDPHHTNCAVRCFDSIEDVKTFLKTIGWIGHLKNRYVVYKVGSIMVDTTRITVDFQEREL